MILLALLGFGYLHRPLISTGESSTGAGKLFQHFQEETEDEVNKKKEEEKSSRPQLVKTS